MIEALPLNAFVWVFGVTLAFNSTCALALVILAYAEGRKFKPGNVFR